VNAAVIKLQKLDDGIRAVVILRVVESALDQLGVGLRTPEEKAEKGHYEDV
jgi:hypothetical protein